MPNTYLLLCGFEDHDTNGAAYPELDRLVMQHVINSIAGNAFQNDDTLIVRHHPAVTAILKAHFEQKPDLLVILEEDAALAEALDSLPHSIHSAFIIGGGSREVQDADSIRLHGAPITLLPLKDTGGAAAHIYEGLKKSDDAHPLLKAFGDVAFGFDLIHRTMLDHGLPLIRTPKP